MARRHQCANCGRDVRHVPENVRRFEGGVWYCSQSCFLAHESSASRSSVRSSAKPKRRRWRRKLGLTAAAILGLFVVLAIIGAVVGGPSSTKDSAAKSHRATTPAKHRKTPRLGTPLRPIPFGSSAAVYRRQWKMKVDAVRTNVRSIGSRSASRGAQFVVVTVTMRYVGGGSATSQYLDQDLHLIGKHAASYDANHDCFPPYSQEINREQKVFSQQTITGDACFEVANNDASTLRLYVGESNGGKPTVASLWFALRRK